MSQQWKPEDGVALRQFLNKTPKSKIHELMQERCPALIDAKKILESDSEGIARLAAMKAGWEAYEQAFFELADVQPTFSPSPDFRDMS